MKRRPVSKLIYVIFSIAFLCGITTSSVYAQSILPPVFDIPQPFVMPGTTEGDNTHFSITDSQYLNVTLDSSEQIKLKMDSVPEMVTLMVEKSASSTTTSTQVTLSGFAASTTYYKYEDSYHNLDQFVTDANGMYSYAQDITSSHIAFIQPRHSTKFIKDDATGGDCTTIGTWDLATKVCTMNTDLTETIQIDSDGVTLDGNGHALTGYNTGNGVYLNGRTGVTIKNLNIKNFTFGIYHYLSSNNALFGNTVVNNSYGLFFAYSNSNTITSNFVSDNLYRQIYLNNSNNNTVTSNTVFSSQATNSHGIELEDHCYGNTLTSNNVSNNSYGIVVSWYSDGNILSRNTSSNNMNYGFWVGSSRGNTLTNNTASNNNWGIFVGNYPYGNNRIYNNNFINNLKQVDKATYYDTFNLASPIGGNYWSNFDTVSEGCSDVNNDNFCDAPYVFIGGKDNLSWVKKDGWLAPVTPVKNINVAIILAEPFGVFHTAATTTAQPCKLIPEKTYSSGYGKEYYTDLAYCINDYYKEVSHGSLSFTFKVFDNGGNWYKITDPAKTEAYYGTNSPANPDASGHEDEFVTDVISLSKNDTDTFLSMNNISAFDIVAVVYPGLSEQKATRNNVLNATDKMTTRTWWLPTQPMGYPAYKFIVAERDTLGAWPHEMGHILGAILTPQETMIPDLYNMHELGDENVGEWDLMAGGAWNGPSLDGSNPDYLSSYTQEFLGWLKEDIHPKSAYGTHWINALETSNLGDTIFRYNLEDNTSSTTQQYYILEARNKSLKTWDSSFSKDKALVLYRVKTKGYPRYGQDSTGFPYNGYRDIEVRDSLASQGDSFLDMVNLVNFSTLADSQTADSYKINTKIEKIDYWFFQDKLQGTILENSSMFFENVGHYFSPNMSFRFNVAYTKAGGPIGTYPPDFERKQIRFEVLVLSGIFVLTNFAFLFLRFVIIPRTFEKKRKIINLLLQTSWAVFAAISITVAYLYLFNIQALTNTYLNAQNLLLGNEKRYSIPPPPENGSLLSSLYQGVLPGLDLHAITPDGKHIGMNYETREYENQIPGSIVSGNSHGGEEWVFVPEGTQVKYYVSAHDNDEFLKQNPQIASTMVTTTDSYSLYARTIDPAVGIFTSPILENQTIAPTEEKSYVIPTTGVDVSLEEVKDFTAPTTMATPTGTLGLNGYHTSAVVVDLTADDPAPLDEVSSGVVSTKYSLDSGVTWNTYSTSTPLIIATEGVTTLQYYSADNNSNSETIKTLTLNIDTVAPTIFASDTSAEQISENGTFLMIPVTVEDNIDPQPTFTTDAPLVQIFTPGVTNIHSTAQDMAGNIATSSIAVTIYSSPAADPDGDGVPNQDDVKPFDATVFANLTIPSEYASGKKNHLICHSE